MDRGLIENTQGFGERLKRAREQAGFNLETLARRLHIRPDIISAIENEDYQNMPASGYAKNMIRSYARTVGLNQNEICEMYLSGLAAFDRADAGDTVSKRAGTQTHKSRIESANSSSRRSRNGREVLSDRPARRSQATERKETSRRSSREVKPSRTRRDYYSNAGTRNHVKTKTMQSTYSLGREPRPSLPSFDYQRLIVPGIIVVIIILLLLIFSLAFGNKNTSSQEDVPAMPISGLTDTSNKDEDTTSDTTTQAVKDHATFKVEVTSGSESWCTVTIDGTSSFADVISGPDSKTFEVKGTLEFETANSEPVKVYIDDAEQTLTADTSAGMYVFSYTFDSSNSTSTNQIAQ